MKTNNSTLQSVVRTIASRFLSPLVAFGLVWLADRGLPLNIPVDDATLFLVSCMMVIGGVVHKLIDRKIHPQDDAK